jgi:hypothetical protein
VKKPCRMKPVREPKRDFALEVHFSNWEFAARYNVAGSDAENMTLGELLGLASHEDRRAFEDLSLGYTETFGCILSPEARARIATARKHEERNSKRLQRRSRRNDMPALPLLRRFPKHHNFHTPEQVIMRIGREPSP